MNEQLEYLRLLIQEGTASEAEHFPKLRKLVEDIRLISPSESRRTVLLSWINDSLSLMELVDLICRIRHLTNNDRVRSLIDRYAGGWNG